MVLSPVTFELELVFQLNVDGMLPVKLKLTGTPLQDEVEFALVIMGFGLTVMMVLVPHPKGLVKLITEVPTDMVFTQPDEFTVATLVFDDAQVEPDILEVNCTPAPRHKVFAPVIVGLGLTLTDTVAVFTQPLILVPVTV